MVNQIKGAHANTREREADVRSPPNGRYNHSSVTSLAFLPDLSRNHLLVSASEADATVKLWDMRTTYSNRRPRPVPVSTTDEPPSHKIHRRFGLTSIAFSEDGSRLYSLCRDHTVYAYSTSHLVLGDAPEMSSAGSQPRRLEGQNALASDRSSVSAIQSFGSRLSSSSSTFAPPPRMVQGLTRSSWPLAVRIVAPSSSQQMSAI